jgi:transposase
MARPKKTTAALPVLNADAAGIDVGADELFVAVPEDRDPQPVRKFGTFTTDLHAIAGWLKQCRVRTVALESTGVYWIPLYQVLEAQGFNVCLVNARHLHSVPGKTDVADCQWLQYLHACGLLQASFRPEQAVCAVRSLLRHRDNLIRYASGHIQQMQKALTQMNLRLHNVISDITGKTGLAILDSILAGERDPAVLAELRDSRIKASRETIIKSLEGDYRSEHLFALRQSLSAYRTYQSMIAECDVEIEKMLSAFDTRPPRGSEESAAGGVAKPAQPAKPAKPAKPEGGNALRFERTDLAAELYRLYGTDLTLVPSFGALTVYQLFSELGRDLSAFQSDKRFCSWLGLCPDNKISGGKTLSSRTKRVTSRAARSFRMAAQSLYKSECYLGHYYRRMSAKLGKPGAITATAHKLARIYYHLVTTGESYDEGIFAQEHERQRNRAEYRLRKQAARLGLDVVPRSSVT